MSISVISDQPPTQPIWFVYILRTAKNSLYTGISTDVMRRFRQHQGEIKGGAKSLRGKGPLNLEIVWQLNSRSEAAKLECYIKNLKRSDKEKLIINSTTKEGLRLQKIPLSA